MYVHWKYYSNSLQINVMQPIGLLGSTSKRAKSSRKMGFKLLGIVLSAIFFASLSFCLYKSDLILTLKNAAEKARAGGKEEV